MYIAKVIFVFMILSNCIAGELQVNAFNIQYKSEYSNELIMLKGNKINIVIKKKKCNQLLIKNFITKLNKKLNSIPKRITKQKHDFTYTNDSQVFYENNKSTLGVFLIKFPNAIKKLSIQNSLLCSSKK